MKKKGKYKISIVLLIVIFALLGCSNAIGDRVEKNTNINDNRETDIFVENVIDETNINGNKRLMNSEKIIRSEETDDERGPNKEKKFEITSNIPESEVTPNNPDVAIYPNFPDEDIDMTGLENTYRFDVIEPNFPLDGQAEPIIVK